MAGTTFRSLVGAALLRDLKLDEFVVINDQSYIELAVKLGLDRPFRESAAKRFIKAMNPTPRFLDPKRYAAAAGETLLRAWEAHNTVSPAQATLSAPDRGKTLMHLIHRKTCRVCGSSALTRVIDLGEHHLQGSFVKEGSEIPPLRKISTALVRCDPTRDEKACGLLQTEHTVPPEVLYSSYWYRSGTNNNDAQFPHLARDRR